MAAKNLTKPTESVSESVKDISTVLYDETFELRDGAKLRLIVDMGTIITKVQEYTQALQDARGLPFDLDNLSARDPIVRYLVTKYEQEMKNNVISEGEILTRARNYYQRALSEAQSQAHLLAFFDSDDNVFNLTPNPYPKTAEVTARFVEKMPEIEKNLAYPIEYTLKQILDLMIQNPAVMGRIMEISEELSVRINRVVAAGGLVETDKDGFHAGSTN